MSTSPITITIKTRSRKGAKPGAKLYPIDTDTQFDDRKITKSKKEASGWWSITFDSGWSFSVPPDSPVAPRRGMTARLYGPGIGSPVRGLTLNGTLVFYRTEEQQAEHQDIELYGADARDWLQRWDDGRPVFSISMGGIGPGYEQCIQIVAAEILRFLLNANFDSSRFADAESWALDRSTIETALFENKIVADLGISGAQWGAALSLATSLYKRGPRDVMKDPALQQRSIQASRHWPAA